MKFAQGCLSHVVVLCSLTVIVDQLIHPHLPAELRFFVAAPAALLLTVGLSNTWSLIRGYGRGDRSRSAVLARARIGEVPRHDGPIVATGTVGAEGQTLRAPISGIDCVAYQYRLYTSQWLPGRKYREVPVYWGYASLPFRLDSPSRAFRIIAMPRLVAEATQHDSAEARERARSHVAATRFEPKEALGGIASSAATMVSELTSEPVGPVRRDWQATGIDFPFEELRIEENVVPLGATVSVSGRWSSERGAIVPGDIGDGDVGLTLVAGGAEELGRSGAAELPFSAWSVAATAAVSLVLGAALVWLSQTGQIAEWWRMWR
jgi:hypothetical protein